MNLTNEYVIIFVMLLFSKSFSADGINKCGWCLAGGLH